MEKMPPAVDLVLHLMYEFQHLAGRKHISQPYMQILYDEAIAEFGDCQTAISAIRDRCGLT